MITYETNIWIGEYLFVQVCMNEYKFDSGKEKNTLMKDCFIRIIFFACFLSFLVCGTNIQAEGIKKSGDWEYKLENNSAKIIRYHGTSKSVVIPKSISGYRVTIIGEKAFENSKIKSVKIPKQIEKIDAAAFANCYYLSKIQFDAENCYAYYFRSAMEKHVFYNVGKKSKKLKVVFGKNCKKIPSCLFESSENNYSHVTDVVISNSVTDIGQWAFSNCKKLKKVKFGNSINKIGAESFKNCEMLSSVTIPKSVEEIGSAAFANCYKVSNITYDAINCRAYYFRSALGTHVFPNVGKNTKKLTVKFGDGVQIIPTCLFEAPSDNYARVTDVEIPSSVFEIQSWAFSNCKNLERVTIRSDTVQFKDQVFENCPKYMVMICNPGSTTERYASQNGFRVGKI